MKETWYYLVDDNDKELFWIDDYYNYLNSYFNGFHPEPGIEFTDAQAVAISIKKFEFLLGLMVGGQLERFYTGDGSTCALCYKSNDGNFIDCTVCPIFKKTGEDSCVGTPYDIYSSDDRKTVDGLIHFLEDEIGFLKSLPEYDPSLVILTYVKVVKGYD